MLDVRIALDYDNLCYMAEYIEGGSLKTICEGQSEKEVIRLAKKYVEDRGEGQIISVYGDIYNYTGKEWKKTTPTK